MTGALPSDEIRWRPSAAHLTDTRVAKLMKAVGAKTPAALHAWSVADIGRFWDTVHRDLGTAWFTPYAQTVDRSAGFPWTKWFVGGRTNIVLNCLDRHANGPRADAEALVAEGEDGSVSRFTYRELRLEVGRLAGRLRALGVGPGDRVGIYMPMAAEVVIALFACLQLGAVAVPVFSAFGAEALAIRLNDAAGPTSRSRRWPTRP
jgi:acetyl-CoA synthetase